MPKIEVQTLCAKISPNYIRTNGYNPRTQTIADVPDSGLEFYWHTVGIYPTVYAARAARTPDQRIVRNPTSQYPATTRTRDGKEYHIVELPITNITTIRQAAVIRIRCGVAKSA